MIRSDGNIFAVHKNVAIIIHEMLHILGIGGSNDWYGYLVENNGFYSGPNGVREYRQLLIDLSYTDAETYQYIPVEDDFLPGTREAHFEEGITEDNQGNIYSQTRTDSTGKVYPFFYQEIMTGFLDNTVYISNLTLGVLEDLGFTVHYSSEYVRNPTFLET